MADQSVRITNLPDAGSPEAVAYEMWLKLRFQYELAGKGLDKEFALFHACVLAVRGYKDIDLSKIT